MIPSVILNTGLEPQSPVRILSALLPPNPKYLTIMNPKIILLIFLTTIPVFSEELTELQKVDQRLEELKTIYRQEQAIINGYTKNRTVPVREGSKEYIACLNASKRIQQAEAEAKTLKERKASIAGGDTTTPEGSKSSSSQPATAQADLKIRSFDFEAVKAKSEAKKGATLIFKGFYLGMPGEDALGLLNHYMKLPQVTSDPVAPAKVNLFTRDGKGPYFIVKTENDSLIAKVDFPDKPFARMDDQGKITEFRVSTEIRDTLFDSKDAPLKEFMQTFVDQYDVPELEGTSESIEYFNQPAGNQDFYTHRSEKGFELKFFGKLTVFDQQKIMEMSMLGFGNHGEEGSFAVKAIQTKTDRSSKFD